VRLRIRRRAKKELLDIDDDATFFAVVRAILDLEANPRPRGYDKVEGQDEVYRIWVGRDWRVLYSIDADRGDLVVETVRRKDVTTYRPRG
jgi:mRNA-degrading endonuclease RelE of RelBE toxin-antitoxin system